MDMNRPDLSHHALRSSTENTEIFSLKESGDEDSSKTSCRCKATAYVAMLRYDP